ncbi:MAG TPA: hypothetical protein VK849_15695 [Longimicrobiales bacterium]|nr:hypothetical protein [Longimicrobiales bacterium]
MTEAGAPTRLRRFALRLAAEFGVVVLGVTVALWADGWAAEHRERAVETARLHALRGNVESTLAGLRRFRQEAEDVAEGLRGLASLPSTDRDAGQLVGAVGWGFFGMPTFHPELNVYDDLKSSGELALLTDPSLRQGLSAMDAAIERLRLAQEDLTTVQQLNLDPFLIQRVDLRHVMDVGEMGLHEVAAPSRSELIFTSDPEFRNLALFKLDLVLQADRAAAEAEERMLAVRHALAEQLGEGGPEG